MFDTLPVLIVGQGIAGTLLSFELWQKGVPFLVMDLRDPGCASRTSGAVLNPYSGRTLKGIGRRSTMYDIAVRKYEQIGDLLRTQIVRPAPLLLFGAEEPTVSFHNEAVQKNFTDTGNIQYFEAVALVENDKLIGSWRAFLQNRGLLWEFAFEEEKIGFEDGNISYDGIPYSKIVLCNGVAAMRSSLFAGLRFTENRGDVLMLQIPDLPEDLVYQKDKLRLLPKGDALFWCGSNYLWAYDNMVPDEVWKNKTLQQLHSWLKAPFELKAHLCAKRPTAAGQIPFIGRHPRHPKIFICNGLGTKGFSAGPMWIEDLIEASLLANKPSLYQQVLNKWL